MTILITKVMTMPDPFTGQPASRAANFIINNGADPWYSYSKGGLPLEGAIQPMLNAEETELYAAAVVNGRLATLGEIALAESRAWYLANPGAKADVFDKTVAQMHTDITAMVNVSFPSASAAVKTGWIRTLMSSLLDTRYNAFEKGLVNGE